MTPLAPLLPPAAAMAAISGFDSLPSVSLQFETIRRTMQQSMFVQAVRDRVIGRQVSRPRDVSHSSSFIECVYVTLHPMSRVLTEGDRLGQVHRFADAMALEVRQAAFHAAERYSRVFSPKSLTVGAIRNALESSPRAALEDGTLSFAAATHVAKIVGLTLVLREGPPGSQCIVCPSQASNLSESPAILLVSSGDGRFEIEECSPATLSGVRAHLAETLCRDAFATTKLQRMSVIELMELAMAMALVDGGGGGSDLFDYRDLARRIGNKSKLIDVLAGYIWRDP